MNKVRAAVIERISAKHEVWSDILKSTYTLVEKDRIGEFGIKERNDVPGVWGHSYVRTYYNWMKIVPKSIVQMEGGIATSYYVLRSLNNYLRRFNTTLGAETIADLCKFMSARTTTEGVGIKTTTDRGIEKIDVNLRHTCFGFLIMREIISSSRDQSIHSKLKNLIASVASNILEPLPKKKLLDSWLNETWPVGGIAVYIAAHDNLLNARIKENDKNYQQKNKVWIEVRERLFDTLAVLNSNQLDIIGLLTSDNKKRLIDHMPYWHPIKDVPVLRLHSTLGCLELVGTEISKRDSGRNRINSIVKVLREQVMDNDDKAPCFKPYNEPSFGAACAMLVMTLGQWYEPTDEDKEYVFSLLSFMEDNWNNPDVYGDYWTEFTAPILDLDEIHAGLAHSPLYKYESAESIFKSSESIKRIMPIALNLSGPVSN